MFDASFILQQTHSCLRSAPNEKGSDAQRSHLPDELAKPNVPSPVEESCEGLRARRLRVSDDCAGRGGRLWCRDSTKSGGDAGLLQRRGGARPVSSHLESPRPAPL